jgi:hypothetical protein
LGTAAEVGRKNNAPIKERFYASSCLTMHGIGSPSGFIKLVKGSHGDKLCGYQG